MKPPAILGLSIAIGTSLIINEPSLAQNPDAFQSAPGPEAPRPTPHPPPSRPPAAEPAPPAPAAAAPAPTGGAPAPVEQVYFRHAPSGVDAAVIEERGWDPSNCAARPVEVRIVEPPRSGFATVKEETLEIPPRSRRGATLPACIGRPILGKRIYYRSKPGFRGTDRISYLASFNGGEWYRYEIRITVE